MAIRARFKVSSKRDVLVPIHWTPGREVQSFFFFFHAVKAALSVCLSL